MLNPKLVFPGQRLTVEEEYAPGRNAYVDDEGNVVASAFGEAQFDEDGREVNVSPKGRLPHFSLDVGTIVIGRVTLVKDAVVILNIGYAEKDGEKRAIYDSSAALGVARAAREFIRSLHDYYKVGDFVRAKVSGVTPYSIEVATNEKGLGVIRSRDEIVKRNIAGSERLPEENNEKKKEE
jgi:exosome complex RNA-binding protein Csl4